MSSKQTTSVISPNHLLIRASVNPDLFGVAELEVHDSGFRQCNAAARVQRPQRVSLQPPLLVHLPLRSHLPRRLHAQSLPEPVVRQDPPPCRCVVMV